MELKTHPRARRLKLRLDSDRETLVLTCPRGARRGAALRWAESQRDWVERQIAALPAAIGLDPGACIPLEGSEISLEWRAGAARTPRLDGNLLWCGGPADGFERRIERWLRERARDLLSADTADCAARAGVSVRRVTIGDARSRWGSCSGDGAIRYNWRLVMAPPDVRRWVVAHEVAHRVHMNHGAEFRALENRLFEGDSAAARSELRRLGPRLKRIGRLR